MHTQQILHPAYLQLKEAFRAEQQHCHPPNNLTFHANYKSHIFTSHTILNPTSFPSIDATIRLKSAHPIRVLEAMTVK